MSKNSTPTSKGILKHGETPESTSTSRDRSRSTDRRLRWDEDNLQQAEADKLAHPRQKIDEPKTPFIHSRSHGTDDEDQGPCPRGRQGAPEAVHVDGDDEAVSDSGSLRSWSHSPLASPYPPTAHRHSLERFEGLPPSEYHGDEIGDPSQVGRMPYVSHGGTQEWDSSEDELLASSHLLTEEEAEERRKHFKDLRAQHYRMKESLRMARELILSESCDDSDDHSTHSQDHQTDDQEAMELDR